MSNIIWHTCIILNEKFISGLKTVPLICSNTLSDFFFYRQALRKLTKFVVIGASHWQHPWPNMNSGVWSQHIEVNILKEKCIIIFFLKYLACFNENSLFKNSSYEKQFNQGPKPFLVLRTEPFPVLRNNLLTVRTGGV